MSQLETRREMRVSAGGKQLFLSHHKTSSFIGAKKKEPQRGSSPKQTHSEDSAEERQTEDRQRGRQRGTVVSLCVSVLVEKDESVERETMKMQIHCAAFSQTPYCAALTFTTRLFS
ncbi:hypothetical protein Q5P01_002438 [Channa striata]|uniref:Uncharacterized protein n=1 Tax=Channa striata TaxID=64152 RepID=A0AA88NR20_CHASR|nr:hypothetical protein Q5P01_002438 [Channa striata]